MYYLKTKLQRPLLGIWLVVCCVIAVSAWWIGHALQISNQRWIIIMWISIVTSLYGIILGAILQSGWWFRLLSVVGIIGSVIKLGLIVLVLFWLHGWTTQAVGAIVLGGWVSFVLTECLVRKHLWSHNTQDTKQYDGTLIQELKHSSKTYLKLILITVMIGILTNGDILIAQYVFGGEVSWTYASVAIIAKFVVFIWLAAETVLLPKLLNINQTPSRSQIWSIMMVMWWFGMVSLTGWWLLWWWVLQLLKPWLESQVWLLLWALAISWCILTLSISSKTLVNSWSRAPLRIMWIAGILRYLVSTMQTQLSNYVQWSVIILWASTIVIQWLRRASAKSSSNS